jgi:hypothetical protein
MSALGGQHHARFSFGAVTRVFRRQYTKHFLRIYIERVR